MLGDIFKFQNHGHDTRGTQMLQLPPMNTITHGINSFKYQAPRLWNSLPNYMKSAINVSEFKLMIKDWKPSCHCGSCIMCKLYLI